MTHLEYRDGTWSRYCDSCDSVCEYVFDKRTPSNPYEIDDEWRLCACTLWRMDNSGTTAVLVPDMVFLELGVTAHV